MTAKEYLMQAKFLDMRINSKIQQVEALNDLATSASSVLTGTPHNPNKPTSKMADAVAKIVDLQAEINRDIDELVDLKKRFPPPSKRCQVLSFRPCLKNAIFASSLGKSSPWIWATVCTTCISSTIRRWIFATVS